jgi:hypothetical protein
MDVHLRLNIILFDKFLLLFNSIENHEEERYVLKDELRGIGGALSP